MTDAEQGPRLVVTVLIDSSARAAAVTRSHGDAMVRAMEAAAGCTVAGFDLVELPIAPKAFAALRRSLQMPPTTVALYDLFPISAKLAENLRTIAGQFLAAEALWAMEEQELLKGAPPAERMDLPRGWDKNPHKIRERLVEAGATDLSEPAIMAFIEIKKRWDAATPAS